MPASSAPAPTLSVSSRPLTISGPMRMVATGVDALLDRIGGTAAWNATRTDATVTHTNQELTVTHEFRLRSAGGGRTELTVAVTCTSPMLAGVPERVAREQFTLSCNQLAATVSHLVVEMKQHAAGNDGLTGAA